MDEAAQGVAPTCNAIWEVLYPHTLCKRPRISHDSPALGQVPTSYSH